MNTIIFNSLLTAIIVYFAWAFGFKRLLMERTRQAMFGVRHELFMLGANGTIDFNDPAYRDVERYINANIRFSHKFNILRFFLIGIAFGGKLPAPEGFHRFYDRIKSHPNKLVSTKLLSFVIRVQLFAMRQVLWSFIITAIAYALAYIIFRSKERMGNFAKQHLTKPADSIESVVLSADNAFQV